MVVLFSPAATMVSLEIVLTPVNTVILDTRMRPAPVLRKIEQKSSPAPLLRRLEHLRANRFDDLSDQIQFN